MLTQDDITTLLEAIEVWKDLVPMEGHQFGDLMQMLMSGGEDKEQAMAKMRKAAEDAQRKHRLRREQGILLQAKLIQMRDQMDIQDALNSFNKGEPPADIPEIT